MAAKRKPLSLSEKLDVLARFAICPGVPSLGWPCGQRFACAGSIEWDHVGALALTGDDDAANFQPLCRGCHGVKTNGRPGATSAGGDKHKIAKTRRLEKRRLAVAEDPGIVLPPATKRRTSTWPQGRKISSRGFAKPLEGKKQWP